MKTADAASQMHRRLAQLKVTARLLEHEIDLAKDGKEVTLDRVLADSVLETLQIYIEDYDQVMGAPVRNENQRAPEPSKPSVTRLN